MKVQRLLLFKMMILLSYFAVAQESDKGFSPTFNWKGFTHIWSGYVQRDTLAGHYGFSVRYLRFKAYGKLTEKIKWGAQFCFDKGNPALLDVYLSYEPFEPFKIQAGQFPVPGAKSGVMSTPIWSTAKMIFNDRPTITQNWGSNAGLKGYRSGGVMVYGNILNKKLHYFVMAAMPSAGPNYYFNASVKSPTYSNDEYGKALFSRLEFSPFEKVELGTDFHIGEGTSFDTVNIKRQSYSFYFLTRQKKLYAMAEYIAGKNEKRINDIKDSEFIYSGYFIEAGYKFANKYEPAIRFDSYTPYKDGADSKGFTKYNNLTLGFNYYPSTSIALMLNYVIRMEAPVNDVSSIQNDLVYIQLRYKFASN